MEKSFRVGIVGCGRIAGGFDNPQSDAQIATHARAYFCHKKFTLAAVVGKDMKEAEHFKAVWGVSKIYSDVLEMAMAEKLDVVSICSPSALHFDHAAALLSAPRPPRLLFIEKPVCETPEQLSILRSLSAKSTTLVLVNHTRRFDALHRKAAAIVASGSLGQFLSGHAVYYGGWRNNGVHLIDSLRMILGDGLSVSEASIAGERRAGDPDIVATLSFNGGLIQVQPFPEHYYQLFETELRFSAGRIRLMDFGQELHVEQVMVNALGERELKPVSGYPMQCSESPMYAAVCEIGSMLADAKPLSSHKSGLGSAAITMSMVWEATRMAGIANNIEKKGSK